MSMSVSLSVSLSLLLLAERRMRREEKGRYRRQVRSRACEDLEVVVNEISLQREHHGKAQLR